MRRRNLISMFVAFFIAPISKVISKGKYWTDAGLVNWIDEHADQLIDNTDVQEFDAFLTEELDLMYTAHITNVRKVIERDFKEL